MQGLNLQTLIKEDFVDALVPALAVAHKRKGVEESSRRGRDCSSMEHLQQFRWAPGGLGFSFLYDGEDGVWIELAKVDL